MRNLNYKLSDYLELVKEARFSGSSIFYTNLRIHLSLNDKRFDDLKEKLCCDIDIDTISEIYQFTSVPFLPQFHEIEEMNILPFSTANVSI